MKNLYRTYTLWLLTAATFSLPASAQEALKIVDIQPVLQNDSLICQFSCPNLFSGKIHQTLLSGLPVLIELAPSLKIETEGNRALRIRKYQVNYDIWEDRYEVETADEKQFFTSLEALQNEWQPLRNLFLNRLENGDQQKKVVIDMTIKVTLLSRREGEKLKNWLTQPQEIEENRPTENRDTGFTLNLNRLISLFFNKSAINESFATEAASDPFLPQELIKNK